MPMHPVASLAIVALFLLELYIPMAIAARWITRQSVAITALERSEPTAGGTVSTAPPASPRAPEHPFERSGRKPIRTTWRYPMDGRGRQPQMQHEPVVVAYQDTHAYVAGRREGRPLVDGYELLAQSEDRIEGDEGTPPEGFEPFADPFEEPDIDDSDEDE